MKIVLSHLDGRVFAIANPSAAARWGWIADSVATEFGCDPDDVHEDSFDEELLVLDGKQIARAERLVLP